MTTATAKNGATVSLKACDEDSDAQKWSVKATSGGYFGLESKLEKNKCLDLPYYSGNKGLKA